jgi:hypothetical protein
MNIPLDDWNGSKATKDLKESIERIQKENATQSYWMLGFTVVAAIAAIIAAIPVITAWFK